MDVLRAQVTLRIDQRLPAVADSAVRFDVHDGDLGNAVTPRKEPGRFNIHDGESCVHSFPQIVKPKPWTTGIIVVDTKTIYSPAITAWRVACSYLID